MGFTDERCTYSTVEVGGCGCARRGRLFSARALYYVIYLSFLSLSFTLLYNGATRRPHNPVVTAGSAVRPARRLGAISRLQEKCLPLRLRIALEASQDRGVLRSKPPILGRPKSARDGRRRATGRSVQGAPRQARGWLHLLTSPRSTALQRPLQVHQRRSGTPRRSPVVDSSLQRAEQAGQGAASWPRQMHGARARNKG